MATNSNASTTKSLQTRTWTKDNYLISTDPDLIPIKTVNDMFASPDVYWANPLPEQVMRETLRSSLCFGMYDTSDAQFIGLARCITDFSTFIYLTDVYVYPYLQGKGLGSWLIRCVQEVVDEMPYLRRSLLFTSDWERSVPFYERLMGMKVLEGRRSEDGKSGVGVATLVRIGRGHPDWKEGMEEEERKVVVDEERGGSG